MSIKKSETQECDRWITPNNLRLNIKNNVAIEKESRKFKNKTEQKRLGD